MVKRLPGNLNPRAAFLLIVALGVFTLATKELTVITWAKGLWMAWPSVDVTPPTGCNRPNHIGYPLWGQTGIPLSLTFSWDYCELPCGTNPGRTAFDPYGGTTYFANIYLYTSASNTQTTLTDTFGCRYAGIPSDSNMVAACFSGNVPSPVFNLPTSICHPVNGGVIDYSKQISTLQPSTEYWWTITPGIDGWYTMTKNQAWQFTTGSCLVTSTNVSMATGPCGSGNPFQNPLTVPAGTTTICIKPYNSSGQPMSVSVDGTVISNNAASGSQINYYGLTTGTHTVIASWAGNSQFCASSDTGTVTEPVCTPNTVTTYFSPNGGLQTITPNQGNPYPVTLGQTVSISANSTSSHLDLLGIQTPSGGNNGIVSNPTPLQWYPVSQALVASLGTYAVTASDGGANGYCSANNTPATTTYFQCNASSPSLTGFLPANGQTLNTAPSSLSWQTNNFGMDQCGSNNTSNDTTNVYLYDGSGTLLAQTSFTGAGASSTVSWINPYTFPTSGGPYNYSWKIVANNGAASFTSSQSFTLNYPNPAWWQTDSGYVFAENHIGSLVPATCAPNCYFNTAGSGSSAVVSYGNLPTINPTANFNGSTNISSSQWFAQAPYDGNQPSFNTFLRQIPPASSDTYVGTFTGTLNPSILNPCEDVKECYLQYVGNMADINSSSGNLNLGDLKVVIFVDNKSSGTPLVLQGIKPNVNTGQGFFGIVASGPVQVSDSTTSLSGFFYTDSTFSTCTQTPCNPEKQLTVTGAVIAKNGVNLLRDLGNNLNKTTPAEVFNYDPSIPFTLPRSLRRLQFQVNEVPPTQ